MTEAHDEMQARELLHAWDVQQAAYITHREGRFAVMLDALASVITPGSTVLDLACGPGSLAQRVLRRFESVRVVAVDYDPLLLELGRHALAEFGDRVEFIDVDLVDPDWAAALPSARIDAAASSTALHWLSPPVVTRLYQDLGRLLPSGGVFVNGDHLRLDDGRRLFRELASADDRRSQDQARADGAMNWDEWFPAAASSGPWAAHGPERERRFADRPPNPDLSVDFHVDALRVGGFAEAGTMWQHYDDYVILARR